MWYKLDYIPGQAPDTAEFGLCELAKPPEEGEELALKFKVPTIAEAGLRSALRESKKAGNHTNNVASAIGIYPC
jgi:hypothetical protein